MAFSKNLNYISEEDLRLLIEQGYIDTPSGRVMFDPDDLQAVKTILIKGIKVNGAELVITDNKVNIILVVAQGTGENSVQQVGTLCEATGNAASAFGMNTHAGGTASHSEGGLTATRNDYDEETETGSDAAYSHVEGLNNATNNVAEHGEGKFGWSYYVDNHDPSQSSIHFVGIGTNNQDTYRKDAEVIMVNGDKYLIGVGGYEGKDITNAKTIQEVINGKVDGIVVTRIG